MLTKAGMERSAMTVHRDRNRKSEADCRIAKKKEDTQHRAACPHITLKQNPLDNGERPVRTATRLFTLH
jgi:hypothetical protein